MRGMAAIGHTDRSPSRLRDATSGIDRDRDTYIAGSRHGPLQGRRRIRPTDEILTVEGGIDR